MWNRWILISLAIKVRTVCVTTVSYDLEIPGLTCVWSTVRQVAESWFEPRSLKSHPSILSFPPFLSHRKLFFLKVFALTCTCPRLRQGWLSCPPGPSWNATETFSVSELKIVLLLDPSWSPFLAFLPHNTSAVVASPFLGWWFLTWCSITSLLS